MAEFRFKLPADLRLLIRGNKDDNSCHSTRPTKAKLDSCTSLHSENLTIYRFCVCKRKLLVQGIKRQDARFGVGARAGRIDSNDSVFFSTERPNPGAIED